MQFYKGDASYGVAGHSQINQPHNLVAGSAGLPGCIGSVIGQEPSPPQERCRTLVSPITEFGLRLPLTLLAYGLPSW